MGGHGEETLAALRTLGGYFAIESHDPGVPMAAPWRPLGELLGAPGALRARAEQVRAALGRAGRLIAPAFAAAVLGRRVPGFDLGQARWIPGDGSMFPLSLPTSALDGAE